ncbi:MAG: hypothetical protein AAFY48_20550 [Bacteroidota bacterium]
MKSVYVQSAILYSILSVLAMLTLDVSFLLIVQLAVGIVILVVIRAVIRFVQRTIKILTYTNRKDPIIVASDYPGDKTVDRRYQEELAMVEKSGNQVGLKVVRLIRGEPPYYHESDEDWEERKYNAEKAAWNETMDFLRRKTGKSEAFFVQFALDQDGDGWDKVEIQ